MSRCKYFLIFFIVSIISIICFVNRASATNNGRRDMSKVFQLNEVAVTEEEINREKKTPNITVIKPELYPMGIGTSVDVALERQPGIDVQRIQGTGIVMDEDAIKIRGFGNQRVIVTRDGRLLDTTRSFNMSVQDWTLIPLHNIDRIEIIKGIGDPRYGNLLGGVVNLVSKELPEEGPVTSAQASVGSFKSNTLSLFHGWRPSSLEYSFAVGLYDSDGSLMNGDISLSNVDFYTGFNFTARSKLFTNVVYNNIKKGLIVPNRRSMDYNDPNYLIPVDDNYPASDGEYLFSEMGGYPTPGSWWEKKGLRFDLGYEHSICDDSYFKINYWRNDTDLEVLNSQPASETSGTNGSGERRYHKRFYDDRSYGGSASLKYAAPSHTFYIGVDYSYLRDDGDEMLFDDSRYPERNYYAVATKNRGIYIMDDLDIGERLTLIPGIRYVEFDSVSGPSGILRQIPNNSMEGISPSLKLIYLKEAGDIIYFSTARALRMPSHLEYYSHYAINSDDENMGENDALIRDYIRYLPFQEEDGLMIQSGWKGSLPGSTNIEISPFYYIIKDYIQFDSKNFYAYNIEKARLYGMEFELSKQLSQEWSMFLNYTFQNSRINGDPIIGFILAPEYADFDHISGMPKHKGNFGLQYKGLKEERLALLVRAFSHQDVIYNNGIGYQGSEIVRQSGFATLDIEGHYPVLDNLELSIYGRNILNKEYQERFGFPAPGRTFGFSLKTMF